MPGPRRGRLEAAVKTNESCVVCHDEQAAEWRGSMHQRSDVDPAYRRAFAIEPLPFCRGCHAPEADPQLEPPASVHELGVGCVTCHVTEEGTVLAAPVTNLRVGVGGQGATGDAHPVKRSQAFATTGGCVHCHEFSFPGILAGSRDPDALFMQTTRREHARSSKATTPCADCHMPMVEGKRSHSFAQVRDADWLRKSIRVQAEKSDHDSVVMTLRQTQPAHGFPTGDLFRRLEVGAELRDRKGRTVRRDVQHLARHFVERVGAAGRELSHDNRIFDEPLVLDLDVAPVTKPAESLRVVYWVKLQRVATVGSGFHAEDAVVESDVELHTGEFSW